MARKKRKQSRKRKPDHEPYPGWMWMLFGLAIGLSVAFAIFVKYREVIQPSGVQQTASATVPAELEPAPVAEPVEASPEEPEQEPRFSFYDMLPNFEVVVSEEEPDVSRDSKVPAIETPGTYILQAGSFTNQDDADRRRAELALLGVESRVQRVMIDDRTYHRVRIGPIRDLDELNRMRARLRDAHIDVLRIRLGD